MRVVQVLILVAVLSGCLSDNNAPTTTQEPPVAPAPLVHHLEFGQPLGYDPRPLPLAASEPYHSAEVFEVPANATRIEINATWSCTSLCRLEVRLHDPQDQVADRVASANEAVLSAPAPEAGTWTFQWITDEVLSVGVSGTAVATVFFD